MGNFGEDLRTERLSRGIALEQISAVTKISSRHLVALEQERFSLLPGGILSKGIVRGYASAVGLDQGFWTERFMVACNAPDSVCDGDRNWAAFANNVGKARIQRYDAKELRWRWLGAIVLVMMVAVAGFFCVRYIGERAGWWQPSVPLIHKAVAILQPALSWLQHGTGQYLAWFK